MKKFIAIYMAPMEELDEMMKKMTDAQKKKMDDGWSQWMKMHEDDFVDEGAPTGKNKRVLKGGVKNIRNEVTGFSVVQAASHDEAAKIFKDNPMLQMQGAYIDVLECLEMSDM